MDENKLRDAGIDYDHALGRFVGKKDLYEKFLTKFIDDEHVDGAKKAYANKDYNEMLEQTHALKGVAGTLGMDALYRASADIVDTLRAENYDPLDTMMERLEAEQKKMIQALTE